MIPDGYTILPAGKLAATVTYLEITAFAPAPMPAAPEGFTLQRVPLPPPRLVSGDLPRGRFAVALVRPPHPL